MARRHTKYMAQLAGLLLLASMAPTFAGPIVVTPGSLAGYTNFPPSSGGSGSGGGSGDLVATLEKCIVTPSVDDTTITLASQDWAGWTKPVQVIAKLVGGGGGNNGSNAGGGGSTAILVNGTPIALANGGDGGMVGERKSVPFTLSKTDVVRFVVGGGGGNGGSNTLKPTPQSVDVGSPNGWGPYYQTYPFDGPAPYLEGGGGGGGYQSGGSGGNIVKGQTSTVAAGKGGSTTPGVGGCALSGSGCFSMGATNYSGNPASISTGYATGGASPSPFGAGYSTPPMWTQFASYPAPGAAKGMGATQWYQYSLNGSSAAYRYPGVASGYPVNIAGGVFCGTRHQTLNPNNPVYFCRAGLYDPVTKDTGLVNSPSAGRQSNAGQIVLQYQAPVCGLVPDANP